MHQTRPSFATTTRDVTVGKLTFRLRVIADLDEAIEHYVNEAPDDNDMIPYYTQLWDSALVLAAWLEKHPDAVRGRAVLELGCGLGLPALTAAKLGGRVTASDYHPDNEAFFQGNAGLNGLDALRYVRLDWRRPDSLAGTFDVVLGSDLIYERNMVPHLVACASRFCSPGGLFLLADPGRAALQDTSDRLEKAGFACATEVLDDIFIIVAFRNESRKNGNAP